MTAIPEQELKDFVNQHIDLFHNLRIKKLSATKLKDLLKRKNPYLFKAKSINTAGKLVEELLGAVLSSSEEKFMGDFLESLAVFVVHRLYDGVKSGVAGVDLEFTKNGIRYLVSVKSGPNWSNAPSYRQQITELHTAVAVIRQGFKGQVEPVIGVCYSKVATSNRNMVTHVYGQEFWRLLSDDPNFYTTIVEPIGFRAKQHNDTFEEEKGRLVNKFTLEFINDFCDSDRAIDWEKLVRFNSGDLIAT